MINQAILKRHSVRDYSNRPVSIGAVKEVIKAAQFAPSAVNNRSWEFLVIENLSDRNKLYEVIDKRGGSDAILQAQFVLIPMVDTAKSILPVQDLSIASENIFLQAAELGLGSFWKNISSAEAERVREAFSIPKNFLLLNIVPIGYPVSEPEIHSDGEFDESKIHFGQW